jgi:thienamycin biosynthesis protein ThnO
MEPAIMPTIQQQETLVIPAIFGGRSFTSLERQQLYGTGGETIAELTLVPLIKAQEAIRVSEEKFRLLQKMNIAELLEHYRKAAELLRAEDWSFASFSREEYKQLVARSTGFPLAAMDEEIEEMADMLDNMENIIRVQLPGAIGETLDQHRYSVPGNTIGYYPAGKSLLVKLPGNIPTICVYWLVPLALKRPVILVPPDEDPFTHLILLEALADVCQPLASCVHFLPCREQTWTSLLGAADQLLLPESQKAHIDRSAALTAKTSLIHFGRTKLLICEQWKLKDAQLAMRRMLWKSGRTCTGLTSVILGQNAASFGKALSVLLYADPDLSFENLSQRIPVFQRARAEQLNARIEQFIRNGEAEDLAEKISGVPRMIVSGEKAILLPTVLLVKKKDSKAFGLELPFPFLTIIEAPGKKMQLEYCRHSLILSVVNGSAELLEELCFETTIQKVFSGSEAERGYHYLDPHEGFLADFLYSKKAVAFGK